MPGESIMANEIRQNKATNEWVIYAPERGERPQDFMEDGQQGSAQPQFDAACPFCPGNEERLPKILMQTPLTGSDEWQTRVVPNKFPALTPDDDTTRYKKGIYLAMSGYGRHEVIIEHPRHDLNLANFPAQAVESVIETYHRRYFDLMAEYGNMLAILFRNQGERAGASLLHPHSQLVVTGVVPSHVRWREEEAQRYFDTWGRCVYCDILRFELQDRRRVLLENPSFLCFVPFAAQVPFEVWIMPKKHESDFGDITDAEKADLATSLRAVLSRFYEKLGNPDYNYVINSAARYRAKEPQLHWYLQIQPRLTKRAGFELGSGMRINPSLPEDDADFLNA
jgi:UDPglucose--hexose-1-phosphate uridylyltransferase